ncbi:hypothetical protein [Dactylosporangium sp. CA-092794]|uniref:hypothetical protein n=1 Tax=Dactylosporangium sp. CA-092794 TaxID=3239929 RepID=UPI003D8D1195
MNTTGSTALLSCGTTLNGGPASLAVAMSSNRVLQRLVRDRREATGAGQSEGGDGIPERGQHRISEEHGLQRCRPSRRALRPRVGEGPGIGRVVHLGPI